MHCQHQEKLPSIKEAKNTAVIPVACNLPLLGTFQFPYPQNMASA